MKFMQWTVLSAALTCLPLAALAQGKPAHKDALLYFVWPQNGATIKGGFWCRFGLRNMGVTHAGDDFDNAGHHHPQGNLRPVAISEHEGEDVENDCHYQQAQRKDDQHLMDGVTQQFHATLHISSMEFRLATSMRRNGPAGDPAHPLQLRRLR